MALSREEIAARYGAALFGFAKDQDALDSVYAEMQALKKAVEANPQLIGLLSDPVTRIDEKKQVLAAIEQPFSEEVKGFLNLLLDYDRFAVLTEIIISFNGLYDSYKGISNGVVTSAVQLDQAQLDRLSASYAKKYGLNSLRLENKVDPKIIGGVILQVQDRVIDGSVKTRLNKIRMQLTSKD